MNLLVDLGNTRIKWAFGRGPDLTGYQAHDHGGTLEEGLLATLWANAPRPAQVACASVLGATAEAALARWCRQTWGRPVRFAASAARGWGLVNAYADPARLGVDRWMAMVGARALSDGGFGVVDAGTAVTVDLVGGDGRHVGGWIVPGARLLHQSLASGTERVRPAPGTAPPRWGTDTSGCVDSGIEALFEGLTRVLRARLDEAGIGAAALFLTGGDAGRFMRLLPDARAVPELVLLGLAELLAENPRQ